ncbi:MAG: hypothetical protein ACRDPP_05955 [Gaiellaceae bacterium]
MRRTLLLALVLALAAGCTGDEERADPPTTTTAPSTTSAPPPTTEPDEPVPVALVPLPARALRECRRLRTLRPACPELVPEAPYDPASPVYVARSRRGIPYQGMRGFELQWGAEHPGEPELDRPPATVHLVVSEGCCLLLDLRRVRVRDGLLEGRRRGSLSFGRVRWAGKRGDLVLAPPFPRGGIEANHLRFTWQEGRTIYGVSLHGWEPFTEVPDVLRSVVESIPSP